MYLQTRLQSEPLHVSVLPDPDSVHSPFVSARCPRSANGPSIPADPGRRQRMRRSRCNAPRIFTSRVADMALVQHSCVLAATWVPIWDTHEVPRARITPLSHSLAKLTSCVPLLHAAVSSALRRVGACPSAPLSGRWVCRIFEGCLVGYPTACRYCGELPWGSLIPLRSSHLNVTSAT